MNNKYEWIHKDYRSNETVLKLLKKRNLFKILFIITSILFSITFFAYYSLNKVSLDTVHKKLRNQQSKNNESFNNRWQ